MTLVSQQQPSAPVVPHQAQAQAQAIAQAQAQQQQRPVPVPQTPELQSMPIRAYLDQTVVPILLDGTLLFICLFIIFVFILLCVVSWSCL
jgi:protein dpy-30